MSEDVCPTRRNAIASCRHGPVESWVPLQPTALQSET